MKKKEIDKWLKIQAKMLPEEQYEYLGKFNSPIEHEVEEGRQEMVHGLIERREVNHGRRLKRLYQKEGIDGVNKYFLARGFKLEQK